MNKEKQLPSIIHLAFRVKESTFFTGRATLSAHFFHRSSPIVRVAAAVPFIMIIMVVKVHKNKMSQISCIYGRDTDIMVTAISTQSPRF
jgi:hypothetical protein